MEDLLVRLAHLLTTVASCSDLAAHEWYLDDNCRDAVIGHKVVTR